MEAGAESPIKQFAGKVVSLKPFVTAGSEGPKAKVQVENPRFKENRTNISPTLDFVSKEFPSKKQAVEAIKYHKVLKAYGFPVPTTFRYLEQNGRSYILETDATEQGKYLIFGINSWGPKSHELETLREMHLSNQDLADLENNVRSLVKKAKDLNLYIAGDMFHVRQDITTREVDVILLDIKKPDSKYIKNHDDGNYWMEHFSNFWLSDVRKAVSKTTLAQPET